MKIDCKYRGKRVDNNEWITGYSYGITNGIHIIFNLKSYEVIPESVGRYEGKHNKDGTEKFTRVKGIRVMQAIHK